MTRKMHLFLFIASAILLVLTPGFASASGCCVNLDLGSCQEVASQSACETGNVVYLDNVACTTACAKGCCCEPTTTSGVGSFNYSCASPKNFYPDSSLGIGVSCTCGAQAYSVSGKITKETSAPISYATVSAGEKTDYSYTDGTYALTDVPGGTNVLVKAFKEGCLPGSTSIPNLNTNKVNIDIQLNCVCAPESCNAANNAYCNSNQEWVVYDLSDPAQNATYCSLCGSDDPTDCGVADVCVDNDDACPTSCSSNPASSSYDSDCVCSQIPNGVCPSYCTLSNDADCRIHSPVCGDHFVTYPYETCEEEPFEGQYSLCSPGDCANEDEIGKCNCMAFSECGNLILEAGETCEIGMVCPDGNPCENCECGTIECKETARDPTLSTSFDSDDKKIVVSWDLLSACEPSIASYTVFKCNKDTAGACATKTEFAYLANVLKTYFNYSDGTISESSEYCYYVRANYLVGPPGESSIVCEKTGDYYCIDEHTEEFCYNNVRSRCDSNNNIEPIEDCNPNRFCMGPDRDEKTVCMNQSVCDACNGLYGMFSNLDNNNLRVRVEEGGYHIWKYCHPGALRDVAAGCYLDRTRTLFSAFDYCANIASCYDYKSYEACTDSNDPCGKNQGCEWLWLDNNYQELGGICRPVAPELQKCEFCDQEEYNWLSPTCTKEVCELFGECHYQGDSSSRIDADTCTKRSTAACLDYADQATCTGGTPVYVNVNYNSAWERTGGTHQVTESLDTLGLGKCYWVGSGASGRCFRNADNIPVDYGTNTGFDCGLGDAYCEADFSNPETTLLPSSFAVYPANVKISFSVSDNYPSNQVKTYFCISTGTCYPGELADSAKAEYTEQIDATGTYNVYYHSQDPAKNLEVVKHTQIKVDADPPFIELTSPATPGEFPTNQKAVPVEGLTSTDSRYVCAQNTNTKKTSCVNNCALTGNKQPCFYDTTGVFNLNIELGTDDLTQVVFYAEDFAGNTYQNTLLGILLDIEPPKAPIITVSPFR